MTEMTQFFRRRPWLQGVALATLMPSLTIFSPQVQANPSGGLVTHGIAEINGDIEGHLKIFQESNKAIINWEDFSIGEGEITEFIQSGDMSALSRVISGNPSNIFGTLKAGGSHILVNPNGILVGAGGVVDVAGMNILSTLNLSDDNFLAGGDLVFTGSTPAGVTNYGTITGGDVIVLGNFVDNSGTIGAPDGVVALGAGGNIVVGQAGDSRISVTGAGAGGATGINNAEGAVISASSVEMKAHGNVYALAINNSGMVRAQGFNFEGGRLTLDAGADGGNIVNTGQLIANTADGAGGTITINAGQIGEVDLAGGQVSANGIGDTAGGTIDIQGAMINVADGVQVTANGADGGTINIGNNSATEGVTVGAGANVSANGSTGSGGFVNVTGTSTSVIDVLGTITADGVTSGGTIAMTGGTINSAAGSVISANGVEQGGTIAISGDAANGGVNVAGLVSANSANGTGGAVSISGADVSVAETGMVQADGVDGGMVSITGEDVAVNGTVSAVGSDGDGGLIEVSGENSVEVGATGVLNASGTENGGTILADSAGEMNFAGTALANGANGEGGRINVTGETVNVAGTALIEATGVTGGGQVNLGGGFQGNDSNIRNAESTNVAEGARISVDSSGGDGGVAVVWADNDTTFRGDISARATGAIGNGGIIEVSGAQVLDFGGAVNASSVGGLSGTALFDPGNLTIGATQVQTINETLQQGTNVLLLTQDGNINFLDLGGGSRDNGSAPNNDRHSSIQWTNSNASFGAFAGDTINIQSNIRTSGGGSINLIAGWTGLESDPEVTLGSGSYLAPEDAWEHYVENGNFGNGGSVIIGDVAGDRHYEVGSRYGNTNVAASSLTITAPDTNDESRYAILGFQDSGSVFSPSFNNVIDSRDLDLNSQTLVVDNDPVVGIIRQNEVDRDGDTIVDGVFGINSFGVLSDGVDSDGDTVITAEEANGTFIPYANAYADSRYGNWWWQQIEDGSAAVHGNGFGADPVGLGGLVPGSGAGGRDIANPTVVDGNFRADINIVTTDAVVVTGGGRTEGSAMIGHGGNSSGWADDRSLRNTGIEQGEAPRLWAFNGGDNDRSAVSIARKNPVYGNINILAGVDPSTVQYDRGNAKVNLTGTVVSQSGLVQLIGIDRTSGANSPTNPNAGGADQAFVQIGHGGTGQFGSYYGDINVDAGGDIDILAGGGSRDHAKIGHTTNGYAYWNPTDGDAQVRFFANTGDFDNPNLRRGELFDDGAGNDARGAYTGGDQSGVTDDDFTGQAAQVGTATSVQVAALDGFVEQTFSGDVNVRSGGSNGITIEAYSTPDIRTGTNADGTGGTGGVTITRDRRFAGIGHGGSSFDVWQESGSEKVRLRIDSGDQTNSVAISYANNDGGTRIGRAATFMNIFGDIDVEATAGNISVIAGNNRLDYASIGHGGADLADYETSNAAIGDISVNAAGNIEVVGGGRVALTANDANDNGSSTNRSYAMIGNGGWESGFQYFAGDIDVTAGGNLTVTGGAYQYDFAMIGHGGGNNYSQVAGDFERDELFRMNTAAGNGEYNADFSFDGTTATINSGAGAADQLFDLSGTGNTANITVTVGGNVVMDHLGNGERFTPNLIDNDGDKDNGYETDWAFSLIGHGGRNVDALQQGNSQYNFDDKVGDITVDIGTSTPVVGGSPVITGGDLTMTNGAGEEHWTAIGHRGGDDRVGGDNAMILGGDIVVNALGSISMDASAAGQYFQNNDFYIPSNENALVTVVPGEADPALDTVAQAGAGTYQLLQVDPVSADNQLDYGDLTLTATFGGNVISIEAVRNNYDSNEELVIAGTTTVVGSVDRITGIITVTSAFSDAGETVFAEYTVRNNPAIGSDDSNEAVIAVDNGRINRDSPVVIGHGATTNAYDVVVLGTGAVINGITANSDITVNAGQDLSLEGGVGNRGMHAQVGHGFNGDLGNDRARLNNVATGFSGNINVTVGNDLSLKGGDAGALKGRLDIESQYISEGNIAAIGHGGHQLDAPTSGDITVYVGNDASITGGMNDGSVTGLDANGNVTTTYYNYAQLGHFNSEMDRLAALNNEAGRPAELNDSRPQSGGGGVPNARAGAGYFNQGARGAITEADTSGNISFVVGNNLTLTAGGTADAVGAPAQFNYAHIGNGGPGISGDKAGDITVQVGNDLVTVDGTNDATGTSQNHYVQIGHADWQRDGHGGVANGNNGSRSGDITVMAGNDITLDHTLIGHADRAVLAGLTTIDQGSDVYIGVSRDNPFDGGTGTLTTTNGTAMFSGFYGFDGELRIYAPSRAQNAMDTTTRLNEALDTMAYIGTPTSFGPATPGDGSAFDSSMGEFAGREDEVYLQPDLFYDEAGLAAAAGILGGEAFPTDATSGQGGAVATVADPGGFPNLVSLNAAGNLGSGTGEYRGSNGVSGIGNYTIYYDAIDGAPVVAGGGGAPSSGGGSAAPVVVPPIIFIPEVEVEEPVPVIVPGFNFFPFLFVDKFDSFDRDNMLLDALGSDTNPGLARLFRALLEEPTEEEVLIAEGYLAPEDAENAGDEEEEKDEELMVDGQVGITPGIFYVYDSDSGEYSSFREFGVPATKAGL